MDDRKDLACAAPPLVWSVVFGACLCCLLDSNVPHIARRMMVVFMRKISPDLFKMGMVSNDELAIMELAWSKAETEMLIH